MWGHKSFSIKCNEKSERKKEKERKSRSLFLAIEEGMRKGVKLCQKTLPPPRAFDRVAELKFGSLPSREVPRLVSSRADDFTRPRLKARLVHAPVAAIRES